LEYPVNIFKKFLVQVISATRKKYPKGLANTYCPSQAQECTNRRHRNKRKHIRFTEDLKQDATRWLAEEKLSPELISGRWQVQGVDGVSHEAIYQWIWRGKVQKDPATAELYKHLKHGRRRHKRGNYNDSRGILSERVGIKERPKVVEQQIKTVERHLNNRPIRKFDYLSPIQQTLKYRSVALMT
jgi:IS30 family transposase